MNKFKSTQIMDEEDAFRAAAAMLGRRGGPIGGRSKSAAKVAAAKANGAMPVREGRRPRGRPFKFCGELLA